VQVVKNLHLPRFTLEKFLTDYCNSKTNTGTLRSVCVHTCVDCVEISLFLFLSIYVSVSLSIYF